MRRSDDGPGPWAWLAAFISFVLPWVALALGLFGLWQVARGDRAGWWLLAAGGVLLIVDIAVDFAWAHSSLSKSDQPELNRRSAQLVGRFARVEEAIVHGCGKVTIGDTVWMAEGPDAAAGSQMRIVAADGSVLRVERS